MRHLIYLRSVHNNLFLLFLRLRVLKVMKLRYGANVTFIFYLFLCYCA